MPGAADTIHDVMDPDRARALAAAIDHPWKAGSRLPPFAHQVYFWTIAARDALGRDGHPRTGGFIPDLGLPRRMWAGGRLEFHAPLYAGTGAEKTSIVTQTTQKTGRSGPLAFVTLRHEIRQAGTLCITEWQDLVYRAEAAPGEPPPMPPQAPESAEHTVERSFTTTDLFRYSALTFNGHRIHHDADYARGTEGYGGLVVHGPLLAQHLMLIAETQLGALREFRFRGTAPLLVEEPARLCMSGQTLWVVGADGRQCMEASAG